MTSSMTQDDSPRMENVAQQAFASYQHEFSVALERSAEVLRHAIAVAQQSIVQQLSQGGVGQLQADVPTASQPRVEPITAKAVDAVFARAKEMLDQVERASAEAQVGPHTQPANPPVPEKPSDAAPADPLAATNLLMSQATEFLNAAMETVLQAINRRPGGTGTG